MIRARVAYRFPVLRLKIPAGTTCSPLKSREVLGTGVIEKVKGS
jgi:hypothetical protein